MVVTWPDGSVTGSVLVSPAPPPVEPKPVIVPEPEKQPDTKKEVAHGDR